MPIKGDSTSTEFCTEDCIMLDKYNNTNDVNDIYI